MTKKPKEVKPTDEDANETAFRVIREATREGSGGDDSVPAKKATPGQSDEQ